MSQSFLRTSVSAAALAVLGLASGAAQAQIVINDTLTGAHSLFNWKALNGACLTAGDNSNTPSDGTQYTPATASLTIPGCVVSGKNLTYYSGKTLVGGATGTLPDAVGSGALRLTNGDYMQGSNGDQQTGAVISNFTFPTNQGVQVTWTSVTYGGDNYNGTGADGMSFFLSDGSKNPTVAGGSGGSLGYSCSNTNPVYDGLVGGYLGVGIDEFGNFTNASDNTASGNGASASTIGVRGAGDVSYPELYANYPTYYTAPPSGYPTTALSTAQMTAFTSTCSTGKIYNMSTKKSTTTTLADYKYLTSVKLPSTVTLANQEAPSTSSSTKKNVPLRGSAVPISYSLKITSDGKMDLSYSVNGGATATVLSGFDIVSSNGALPASFRFGFSAGTGAGSNVHEITCFKAAPADTSNSSAGSNVQSQEVVTGSQVFLAYYHPVNWWGSLTANGLVYDSTAGTLSAAATATWDASCVLTGGTCTSTGGSNTAQTARVILSNNGGISGGTGVAFTASGLTSAQLASLGDTSSSAPRLAYLRGTRTNEVGSGTGLYRVRTGVLGDIVDSSPVLVSYPSSSYTGPWADKLNAATVMPEGSTYSAFMTAQATRPNIVFVGANDGMLHGFAAGSFAAPDATGNRAYSSTGNNGAEVLAYVPAQVVSSIYSSTNSALDFTSPSYYHNFFVDATPGTGDLYYGGAWHTWVVGGLGVGGHPGGAVNANTTIIPQPVSSLFALDVTNTTSGTLTEANASSLVVGDWTSSTISCGVQYTISTTCGIYMGQTLGTPIIRRLHDGGWAVIFGNGTNSYGNGNSTTQGHSGLFIMHVSTLGTKTFQYIDANAGPAGGIAEVASVDLDGDHVADYVYGGDTLGNLYRFDLTSTNSTAWTSMKIFSAGSTQPITTAPVVATVPGVGTAAAKVLVAFGTGQKLPVTLTSAESYATGTQALYGIWDANMTAWNATTTDTKYAALTQSSSTTPVSITSALLTKQTITATSTTTRTITNNAVCWAGGTACSSGNTQMGWVVSLPTTTEQAIYNPTYNSGMFYINTTIPATSTVLTCSTTPVAGWTMGISTSNGGAGSVAAFSDGSSGESLDGTGTAAFYVAGGSTFLGTNSSDTDKFKTSKLATQPGVGARVTWTKIR